MTLSIIFFLLYIAAVVAIGVIASRKETEEDFMIAGRRVSGFQVAATMSAGYFDGSVLAVYLAYIYQYGLSALWLFMGIAVGFLFLRKYAVKIKERADALRLYTMPEYFAKMFGKRSGIIVSVILVIQYFLLLIVNLIISGKVLAAIFPLPYALAVAIGGAIILTYLLLAGFKAVIRTDFFQLLIMFVMSITVAGFLLGKTRLPVSELNLFNFQSLGIGNLLGFLIIGALGMLVTPDLWQRIFATKDQQNARRGLAYSAGIFAILIVIISVVGIATKQFFPNIAPEDALVTGFANLLPFGLKEFGLVLLYAVALSSSDTVTFVVSSIFTRDLKNYSQRYSEASMKKLTRIFMILFVVLAVTIAILYQNILALGFSLASLSLALFPATWGSFYWRLKDEAVFWSSVLALASVMVLFVSGYINPQTTVIALPVALVSLIVFQKLFRNQPVPAP